MNCSGYRVCAQRTWFPAFLGFVLLILASSVVYVYAMMLRVTSSTERFEGIPSYATATLLSFGEGLILPPVSSTSTCLRVTSSTERFERIPSYAIATLLLSSGIFLVVLSKPNFQENILMIRSSTALFVITLLLCCIAIVMTMYLADKQDKYSICMYKTYDKLCYCRADNNTDSERGWIVYRRVDSCAIIDSLFQLMVIIVTIYSVSSFICLVGIVCLCFLWKYSGALGPAGSAYPHGPPATIVNAPLSDWDSWLFNYPWFRSLFTSDTRSPGLPPTYDESQQSVNQQQQQQHQQQEQQPSHHRHGRHRSRRHQMSMHQPVAQARARPRSTCLHSLPSHPPQGVAVSPDTPVFSTSQSHLVGLSGQPMYNFLGHSGGCSRNRGSVSTNNLQRPSYNDASLMCPCCLSVSTASYERFYSAESLPSYAGCAEISPTGDVDKDVVTVKEPAKPATPISRLPNYNIFRLGSKKRRDPNSDTSFNSIAVNTVAHASLNTDANVNNSILVGESSSTSRTDSVQSSVKHGSMDSNTGTNKSDMANNSSTPGENSDTSRSNNSNLLSNLTSNKKKNDVVDSSNDSAQSTSHIVIGPDDESLIVAQSEVHRVEPQDKVNNTNVSVTPVKNEFKD